VQELSAYLEHAADAAAVLRRAGLAPADIVVQCGSGLSLLAETLFEGAGEVQRLPMREVPQLPPAAVGGHGKEILAGQVGAKRVLVFSGRIHMYEGYSPEVAGFAAAVAQAAGAAQFVLTNAAGGLNQHFRTGDVMLHNDFINFQGDNALAHLATNDLHQRFIDPKPPYDMAASGRLGAALGGAGLAVHQGVYIGVRGPIYETRAELAMFRSFGADAIGMSSIPEIMVCNQLRLPVVGVSLITNECFAPGAVGHDSVLDESRNAGHKLGRALRVFAESA
jgi:purine-nucleoside phosphorylase